jgi:hypothetical protein
VAYSRRPCKSFIIIAIIHVLSAPQHRFIPHISELSMHLCSRY